MSEAFLVEFQLAEYAAAIFTVASLTVTLVASVLIIRRFINKHGEE